MRTGNFRLFRQADGRGAFAHVHVEIAPKGPDGALVSVVSGFDPALPHELLEAAIAGSREAIEQLAERGLVAEDDSVRITAVQESIVDTKPGAVRAAAFLAVVHAFDVQDDYQLDYSGDWIVRRRVEDA